MSDNENTTAIVEKTEIDGKPVSMVEPASAGPTRLLVLDWRGTDDDDIPNRKTKDYEDFLRDLVLDVDLIADAVTAVCQKVGALSWYIEGPERTATDYRDRIMRSWTTMVQEWVREVCWSHKGGHAQVVRFCPRWAVDDEGRLTDRGTAALEDGKDAGWEFAILAALDSRRITPTGDPMEPVAYSPIRGGQIRLKAHQVLRIIDSPIADASDPGYGQCGVERCLEVGLMRRYIARYFREAFGDKPRAGLVLLNNVLMDDYEEAINVLETEKSGKRIKYFRGQVMIANAEASEPATANEIPFRIAPEGWSQRDAYQEAKEVISTAFGLDPMEFGAMPGQQLGSAEQSTVMARKSRGKFFALLIEGIEREITTKVLPDNCAFHFVSQDVEEEREEAESYAVQIENIRGAFESTSVGEGLISREEGRQMLVDIGWLPREYLEAEDVTDRTDVEETEPEIKAKAYSDGRIIHPRILDRPRMRLKAAGRTIQRQQVNAYTANLRQIYEEWAESAAETLADADEEEREAVLAALLALLATRLKAAGRSGLNEAFQSQLEGAVPSEWALEFLEARIAENDTYIAGLIEDARARFAEDSSAPGFLWTERELRETLPALAWRAALYGGVYWAVMGLGAAQRVAKDTRILRELDPAPGVKHCQDCIDWAGEYENFETMVALIGLPGQPGTSACNGNCRCRLYERRGGEWVRMLY